MTQDEIFAKVRTTLVDALNVDDDEVTPTARLRATWTPSRSTSSTSSSGSRREFGIKIPREELFPESIFQGDPEFVTDGKVTPKGWSNCRPACPSPT